MLMYLVKANVVLVVLFGFYQLISGSDTFLKLRRVLLLLVCALALLLPTIDLSVVADEGEPLAAVVPLVTYTLPEITVRPESSSFDWQQFVLGVYALGTAVLFFRTCWQVVLVCRLARRSERAVLQGITVCLLQQGYSPFSFFGWIFVDPTNKTPQQLRQVLTHEQVHVAQCHSIDMLLTQLFVCAFWLNPLAWLMRMQVRNNLEYLADRSVVRGGTDKRAYQYHLLAVAHHANVATITNNFNVLPLKKRIMMMNKQTSNPLARMKYLLMVPLALVLMAMNSNVSVASVQKKVVKKTAVAKKTTAAKKKQPTKRTWNKSAVVKKADVAKEAVPEDDKVYEVVEQMPQFVGGDASLMKYLSENVKYPVEAQKNGVQGRIVISFIVEKDGAVSNVKIARSVDDLLDKEACRVVKQMPKWTPGMQNGKPVRVKYNVPVSFRLK